MKTSLDRATPVPSSAKARLVFDVDAIRNDFPILQQKVYGKPLIYLDNAASSQKPRQVMEAITQLYSADYSNIHRGVHALSERSTRAYEDVRRKVQHFINAAEDREIIFVRGTTEAINLVAQSYGRQIIGEGDEILITTLEHHSNIVPWQLLCEAQKARLLVAPIDDAGDVELDSFEKLITERTKLVAVAHVSNALGTVNPLAQMIDIAHRKNVPILVDGAQAIPHLQVDVKELGCDFYAFSGHKLFGPTGIGVLYGKAKLLEAMPPYQGGGDMIASVTFEKSTFNKIPFKFEAGTPDIAGVVGLGAAIDYVSRIGFDTITAYELDLLNYARQKISGIPGVRIMGNAREIASVLSFLLDEIHPHDIGTILDQEGIAIRAGHHCAQPVMDRYGVPATARASFAFYNTKEEIDVLVEGLRKVLEVFG
ncbi:MAG: cysteine desulfurase [Terriglobia bacterium]